MKSISKRRIGIVGLTVAVAISAGTLGAFKAFGFGTGTQHAVTSAEVMNDLAAVGLAGGGSLPTASTDIQIRSAEAAVSHAPHLAQPYVNLAGAYMQKARETLDVTYYTLTANSARSALRIDPNNYGALTIEAWVALARHEFSDAAQLSLRAIRANPYDDANYGALGDAYANLGNYKGMLKAYQKEMNLKPSLASYNRASYAQWLYGNPQGAYQLMWLAIRAGSTSPENIAWCYTQLGDDYMAEGFVPAAETAYKNALRAFPHYAGALNGLAGVDVARANFHAAVREYRRAIAIVPLTQYVTNLQDLYTRLGDGKDAAKEADLIGFIERIYRLNGVQYGVEEAQYDADHNVHLAQALSIARAQVAVRKDIKTWDTYAWVLYKEGQYAPAWQAEQQALRLHTKDALLCFHAGMMLAALHQPLPAQSYLTNALLTNPSFHILYAGIARSELKQLSGVGLAKLTRKG